MANKGAWTGSISSSGGSCTVPAGYHNGSGKVTGPTLASLVGTNVNLASAGNLLSGSTAYGKNGTKYTGSMTNRGAWTGSISGSGGSCTIPSGYHNGSGKVTGPTLSGLIGSNVNLTSGGYMLSGTTAYGKNGTKYTGNIATRNSIQTATTATNDQSKSCYRLNGSNIEVVPAIGYWNTWDWSRSCIKIPINNVARMTSGDWTVTAGWCGFRPDIVFFRGNVSGTNFPVGIYCNVNGMYINVVEGQSQSHFTNVITVNDTGWGYTNEINNGYVAGRAIKYVCLKITP